MGKSYSYEATVYTTGPGDIWFHVKAPPRFVRDMRAHYDPRTWYAPKLPIKGTVNGVPFRAFFTAPRVPEENYPYLHFAFNPLPAPKYTMYLYAPIVRALGGVRGGMRLSFVFERDLRRVDGKPLTPRAGPGALVSPPRRKGRARRVPIEPSRGKTRTA